MNTDAHITKHKSQTGRSCLINYSLFRISVIRSYKELFNDYVYGARVEVVEVVTARSSGVRRNFVGGFNKFS